MSDEVLDLWAQFERDGYVVVPGSVTSERCDAATADVERFKARNRRAIAGNVDGATRMNRVVNLHAVVDSLQPLFTDNTALDLCDRFFDDETVLYTSLFYERGSEQELHHDSPAFTTRPEGRYMGVWVAMEDVDADNGPLLVLPGSHRLPPIDVAQMATGLYGSPDGAPHDDQRGWDTYQRAVQAQCEERGITPVEVRVGKGDTVVWHPLLLHGGAPHKSASRTRRSMVFHVTPPYTAVYGQEIFFNPSCAADEKTTKRYTEREGRKVPETDSIDFAHQYAVRVDQLHRPDDDLAGSLRIMGKRAKQWARGKRGARQG